VGEEEGIMLVCGSWGRKVREGDRGGKSWGWVKEMEVWREVEGEGGECIGERGGRRMRAVHERTKEG